MSLTHIRARRKRRGNNEVCKVNSGLERNRLSVLGLLYMEKPGGSWSQFCPTWWQYNVTTYKCSDELCNLIPPVSIGKIKHYINPRLHKIFIGLQASFRKYGRHWSRTILKLKYHLFVPYPTRNMTDDFSHTFFFCLGFYVKFRMELDYFGIYRI